MARAYDLLSGLDPAPPKEAAEYGAVARTVLPAGADAALVQPVLTARMTVLTAHSYRYAPEVVEIEAVRAAWCPPQLVPHEDAPGVASTATVAGGWLPSAPEAADEAGWRAWCRLIEEHQRLVRALCPPAAELAFNRARGGTPQSPPGVPPLEAWLRDLAGVRMPALLEEARRQYHSHDWFVRDRTTPPRLLRVRARLAKRPQADSRRRPWDLANDSMEELEAEFVRCAPAWWYRLVVERGAIPLEDLEAVLAEWQDLIGSPSDAALYEPPFTWRSPLWLEDR